MILFQKRALKEGAAAVVNIHNRYKKEHVQSALEYIRGAGAFVAKVRFSGRER